jgi:predicted PhzF superfamily epimerase YddE/YHI9
MAGLHLLRVFCHGGEGGNPLAVFLDGAEVPAGLRQRVAADLGLSETVFVDDAVRGEMRIFTPAVELEFAGHPTVGTAWLLARERGPVPALRPTAGEVAVRYEHELTFVAARPEWAPPFDHVKLDSPAEVEALEGPPGGGDVTAAWAWMDERAGLVRSRVFPVRYGIPEDEATGAAALRLCALLDRPIDIRQGRGSRILARPLGDGRVEIGGESSLDESREYQIRQVARPRFSR